MKTYLFHPFLLTIFGPINYGPPIIALRLSCIQITRITTGPTLLVGDRAHLYRLWCQIRDNPEIVFYTSTQTFVVGLGLGLGSRLVAGFQNAILETPGTVFIHHI